MIRKVKAFFHNFIRSLIPHSLYYSKIAKSPFSFSLFYFLIIIFILNVVFVLSLVVKYNPPKINTITAEFINSLNNYPDNLTINIQKGRLMTTDNQPYLFWLNHQNNKELILVVDESADPLKIQKYKSNFLLTPQELVIRNTKNNTISTIPLTHLDNYKITKQTVSNFVQSLIIFQKLLPLISVAFLLCLIIVLPLASLIVMFLYLLISSLTVFILYKILAQKHFHFKKVLQVAFHAATLPLLLDYGLIIFRPTVPMSFSLPIKPLPFPFLFFILLAIFVGAGVYEAHTEESVKNPHHHAGSTKKHSSLHSHRT